jgi:hypothetical protein
LEIKIEAGAEAFPIGNLLVVAIQLKTFWQILFSKRPVLRLI